MIAKRLGFRFVFLYFVLYSLPFPLDALPFVGASIDDWWMSIWTAVVPRLAKPFLGRTVTLATAGSSDTTFHYAQIVVFLVIAAVAAAIWCVLDRNRPQDERLYRYLYVYLRFVLAAAMLWYGIQKVVPSQFRPPSLDRMVQTYGSFSPMGLMWTFMGTSPAYEMFSGAAELLAGLLLLARRTALLGALVTIAVMSNVVALNLSFDVSVKMYASNLLLLAVFIAAPDARRLAEFFLRAPSERLFEKRWAHVAAVVVAVLLVARLVYSDVDQVVTFHRQTISLDKRSPLRGVWSVDVLDVDGVARPPLVTDAARWRRVVFDYQGQSSIFLMSDQRNVYKVKLDETKKIIDFTNRFHPEDAFRLAYARPDAATLRLDGTAAGHTIHAVCKLEAEHYPLTSGGFRWISERALMYQ